MRCYYHPEVEAIGVCKNCYKGIRDESAAEVGGGLACRGRCEQKVQAINDLVARNVAAYPRSARLQVHNAIWTAVSGVVFGAYGLVALSDNLTSLRIFMLVMGITYLGLAGINFLASRSLRTK